MLPQRLDTLFAYKAISLSPLLSSHEKRVAATVIDHFNRKTGQCDPSLNTIAALLAINRQTVIRAVNRLVRIGFFSKIRHGGHFHRNSYQPVWHRFRQLEAEWSDRRRQRKNFLFDTKQSPLQCETRHFGGDSSVTQTCTNNQFKETFAATPSVTLPKSTTQDRKRLSRQEIGTIAAPRRVVLFPVKHTSSRDAARDAAERRWTAELHKRFAQDPARYGQVLEAIDSALQGAATDAELAVRGSGLALILHRLGEQT